MKPLLSICLPIRNGEAFLDEAIESILSQTEHDFEVLIPDDCSKDRSFEIVEKYASKDRRLKLWRNVRRLGLFANYNQCLRSALGTYIKPMAQDDILLPEMLKECLALLRERPEVILVSTGRTVTNEAGSECQMDLDEATPLSLLGSRQTYHKHEIWRASLMPTRNFIGEPCTVMFRASAADTGFSELLHHLGDLEFWLRLLNHGDYAYIPAKLVQFRRHCGSATDSNIAQLRIASDLVHCSKLLTQQIRESGFSERDFLLANLSCFSKVVAEQVRAEIFDDEKMLGDPLSRADELGLKKALIYSLMLVAGSDSYQTVSLKNASRIARYEASIRKLLDSFPWRVTRPLRELKRVVIPTTSDSNSTSKQKDFKDQVEYIFFLKSERKKILGSPSWRTGRKLLQFVKAIQLYRFL